MTALASGDTVTIRAEATNPSAGSSDAFTVTPGDGEAETTVNTVAYGTSVGDVSVTVAPAQAAAPATYVVSFEPATSSPAGGEIALSQPETDFSLADDVVVTDVTAGWRVVPVGPSLSYGRAVLPLTDAMAAGDVITVELTGVINPPAGAVTDFDVSTSSDTSPTAAAVFVMGAGRGTGVAAVVSPAESGVLATYGVAGFEATSALVGGVSTITLTAPGGTVFPRNPSDYTVQDSTAASGSGTVTAPVLGSGTDSATFKVPKNVQNGDSLVVTVQDVFNPAAAGTYAVTIGGDVTGPPGTATPAFPDARAVPSGRRHRGFLRHPIRVCRRTPVRRALGQRRVRRRIS